MPERVEYAAWLLPVLAAVLVGCALAWWLAVGRVRRGRPVLRRRRRRPVPWGVDGGAALAVLSLGTSLLGAVLAAAADEELIVDLTLADAAMHAASMGVLCLLVLGWQRSAVGAIFADFGLPWWSSKTVSFQQFVCSLVRDVGHGVGLWLLMLPPVYVVQSVIVGLLGQPSGHPTIERLLSDPSGEGFAAAVLMAVVVAPVYEEFAFRVMLQGWLERVAGSRRAWSPIVFSSLLFAAAHTGQGFAPAPLFVLALGLGYVYRQTHRFLPCVVAHAAFNALSLLIAAGVRPVG